eukprot:gene524-563_t
MSSDQRPLDIIVYGASGLVGKLICEYLIRNYPDLRWAMSGKDEDQLMKVAEQLHLQDKIPIYVVEAHDMDAMRAIFSRTAVLLSVAGPYLKIGLTIIEACVDSGTHYVDITGEPPFIRKSIDAIHDRAAQNQVKIVHSCGFDCIPADLGVYMMTEELGSLGATPLEVTLYGEESKGSVSKGTVFSLIGIYDSSSLTEVFAMASPYYLNPRDLQSGQPVVPHDSAAITLKGSDITLMGYDFFVKSWTAPYLMQFIDTRVVNRSNALRNWSYGKSFVFLERTKTSFALALLISSVVGITNFLLLLPFIRQFLKWLVPLHLGPSSWMLDHGFFHMLLIAKGQIPESGKEVVLKGHIHAVNGDPGYRQTAKMAAETALALVQDRTKLPCIFGVLTPSVAIGSQLIHRLRLKGVHFSVER